MTTDAAPQDAPAPEPTWRPAPGDNRIYLYGHETVLKAWVPGWVRIVDADGNELVRLHGRGTDRTARTTFATPDPEDPQGAHYDPGQPHVATVELSADCFDEKGRARGSWQHYRLDQEGL